MKSSSDPKRNKGWIRQTFPSSAGGTRGGVIAEPVDDSFKGNLKVHSGEVKLSLISDFSIDITFDDHTSGALAERSDEVDLFARDDPIDLTPHLISYAAGFSALTRLIWNHDGVDLQIDPLKGSLINHGHQELPAWKPDEGSNPIGSDPGSSNIHKNDGDSHFRGRIPQHIGKRPYTLFDAKEALVCATKTEEEEDKDGVKCGNTDLCAVGLAACPDGPGIRRRPPRTSKSRRDSGFELSVSKFESQQG